MKAKDIIPGRAYLTRISGELRPVIVIGPASYGKGRFSIRSAYPKDAALKPRTSGALRPIPQSMLDEHNDPAAARAGGHLYCRFPGQCSCECGGCKRCREEAQAKLDREAATALAVVKGSVTCDQCGKRETVDNDRNGWHELPIGWVIDSDRMMVCSFTCGAAYNAQYN